MAAGLSVGLVAAGVVAQMVSRMLFGLAPLDLPSFAAATALLVALAVTAAYVPARRAAQVDPKVALRQE